MRKRDKILEHKPLKASFLHIFLAKSVQNAHVASVDFLWYRFVMGRKVLAVKPDILCGIGSVALHGNKPFIPPQLCQHFESLYGRDTTLTEYRDELLRIRVESFAKTTGSSTTFREKWKVFLEDIDNRVNPANSLRVRDFPYLAESVKYADRELLDQLLFSENKLTIKNETTLPLLLNMILLQSKIETDFKIGLFCGFHSMYKTLNHDDSVCILFRLLRGDPYRSNKLMQYLTANFVNVPPFAAKYFLETTGAKA